uniref:Glutamate receptor IIB,Glutamate receptor IIB n=1 Tax=Drosophila melanogaster TaxID=7227 RepID=UPI000620A935|nr:Chain A, Glutamate receptor IIB,Glutamate receptor IIB [Drosophila melanogaster]4WXJ_B Chain B, Glutamate receptor IIB,Glutamate receptor IIB [Drosophila melanogaster]
GSDFSQKPIRYTVATRVGKPYFSWREEPEGVHYEGNERFEGYAVDLIYMLAQECKFDFNFEPVRDNKYGSYDANTDEWDGIIRQLIDNNAQIGICDLTITQARRSVVDFTVPFMQLGISILSYKGTDIGSLHDLVDQNKVQFGTIRGGATSVYFSESNDTDNRMAWNKMLSFKPDAFTKNNEEGVDRVKLSKGTYAFLMETTNLQYYVQRNCELTQIGESFGEKHYGIAVPLNADFRSNLSVGILRLSERGELFKLRNKWFNSNESTCD